VRAGRLLAVALVLGLAAGCRDDAPPAREDATASPAPRFVGRAACADCHEKEDGLWQGSSHDLAMQPAGPDTVLGDFSGARFDYHGVVSTFFRKDGRYLVRTDGPDGELREYEIAYTFGAAPLQQYLIAFPGGRYQALSVCWDSRPAKDGGLRWFHLYPGEDVDSRDVFHWTGPYQNWNFMCAECHSTGLDKGYHPAEDRYETTWSEIDVSCEACHGPGSLHVAWGEAVRAGRKPGEEPGNGLAVSLADPARAAGWEFDMARGIAARAVPRTSRAELETCARCHARRSVISEEYVPGRPLMDTHLPALLEEALYFADGQIKDEVYEYGSFLQSRMHAAGVSCGDCHDPHGLEVRVSADLVCAGCHLREKFDTASHHFHRPGSPGARCVECHMPARTYMGVDPRRDHSFKVPRPDLTLRLGTPNACGRCHRDRPAAWAAGRAARWWPGLASRPQFAEAIEAGRGGRPGAEAGLRRLAGDSQWPAIVRATAVSLLGARLGPGSLPVLDRALGDPDPLVRVAALGPMTALPPAERVRLAAPLLTDPIRAVRIAAARPLAVAEAELPPERRPALAAALAEWTAAQAANADRAEAHMNLGGLHAERGDLAEAERAFHTALRRNRWFAPAWVALADTLRLQGREGEAEAALREGLLAAPGDAELHGALGLSLARQKRVAEALAPLERAAALGAEDPHHAYVFGVALHDAGQGDRALAVLREAHERHPGDRDLLVALATFSRERGDRSSAAGWARKLVDLDPADPQARGLLAELGRPR